MIATVNAVAENTGIAEINVADSLLLAGDGSGTEVSLTDKGEDSTKIYIANTDGTYAFSEGTSLSGTVNIDIETDIDGDGDVSLTDVSRFMSAWFSRGRVFDFNGDGRMTFTDFGIILSDSFFK